MNSVITPSAAAMSGFRALIVTVLLLAPGYSARSQTCAAVPSGIVGWWRAEDTTVDLVTGGAGSLLGGEAYEPGEVGAGFYGNANGDGVVISNSVPYQLQTLTIEAWVKRATLSSISTGSGGNGFLVGFGGGGYAFYLNSNGSLQFNKLGDTSGASSGAEIFDLNFHHVAVTVGGGSTTLYLDANIVDSVNYEPVFTYSGALGIGIRPDNGDNSFEGTLDEISIYNRALSEAEIHEIYAAGAAGKCSAAAPVILTQPTNETVFSGNLVVFSVAITGTPPIAYSWSLDGTDIPSATNSTLVLEDVEPAQAGTYAVTVSNPYGTVKSANAVLVVGPTQPCDPPPSGIVAWWRGEGTAADAIGNDNGSLAGGEAYGPGEAGQGFLGNGNGSGVLVTNTTELQLQSFTLEQWIQRGSSSVISHGSGGNAIIAGFGSGGYSLYLNSSGQPNFGNLSGAQATATPAINDLKFHHLAVTLGNGTLTFYLDGTNAGLSTYNGTFTFSGGFGIGYRPDNADNSFLGTIDELAIYNRALTASDVRSIFNAGHSAKCDNLPPVIKSQPTNQSIYVGDTAVFSVSVTGSEPLVYSWSFNGTPIPSATNYTLVLPDAQSAQSGNYTVTVTNAVGEVESTSAALVVNATPPCDPPPAGIVAWWRGDDNTADTVGTDGGSLVGGESYANAEVGRGFVGNGSGSGVLVANTADLQLQTLTLEQWIQRGSTSVISYGSGNAATIAGFGPGGYTLYLDNTGRPIFGILGGAQSSATPTITDLNFHHLAVTLANGTVTFYLDGAFAGSSAYTSTFTFSGGFGIGYRPDNADNSFLGIIDEVSIYNRALSPNEIQAIFATGAGGKCDNLKPLIEVQPLSQTSYPGDSVELSVLASGSAPLSYRWSFDGVAIPSATSSTLVLTDVGPAQAGVYSVTVANSLGSIKSSNAVLVLATSPSCDPAPPGLVAWWRAEFDTADQIGANEGTLVGSETYGTGKVGLGFAGSGSGSGVLVTNTTDLQLQTLTLEQWIQRGSSSVISHGSGGNGIIAGFGPGGYILYLNSQGQPVFGTLGGAQNSATPAINDQNFHHLAVTLGNNTASFYLDGTNAGVMPYTTPFTFSGGFGIGYRPDNGDDSFLGIIDEPSIYGRALAPNEIKSIFTAGPAGKCPGVAPSIISQPANLTLFVGFEAAFSVSTRGTAPFAYQWLFNGQPLAGATNATLDLGLVLFPQAGSYAVIVSNAFGVATSSNATLTVNAQPACDPPPSGLVGWWRGQSNTIDFSGNNATGILTGGETYGPGEVGSGYSGTGSGSGVLISNTTALQSQNITIEAWVRRASPTLVSSGSGGNGVIAGFGNGGYLLYMNSGGNLIFAALGSGFPASSSVAITDTNFHHLAVTLGSGAGGFYIDGTNVNSFAFSTGFTFTSPFGIGFRADSGDNSFLGVIDEPSVYDRALTANEIQTIYNAKFAGKCYSDSLPVITQEPVNVSAPGGGAVSLTISAGGAPPLAFQWFFDGVALSGATNSALRLSNLQASNAGSYYVEVTNALGSAVSTNVTIDVNLVTVYVDGQAQTNSPLVTAGPAIVALTNYYADGDIFYTLDGSKPTPYSPLYTAPFTVNGSVVINTLAFSADFQQSTYSTPFAISIAPAFKLTTVVSGGGVISANPQMNPVFSNSVVTLTATATNGWSFLRWSGDALGSSPEVTVQMNTNKTVEAIFGTAVKTIAAGGSIVLDPPGPVFPYGFTVQAGAVPIPGNAFVVWGESASGTTNPLPFTVLNPNPTISALFTGAALNSYSVTVLPRGEGTVSMNPAGNLFPPGQSLTLTATPNPGQQFLGWSGSATGNANPLNISVTGNAVVYANFSVNNAFSVTLGNGHSPAAGVVLNITGEIGTRYRLDGSPDLSVWTTLLQLTNTTGILQYLDLTTTNRPQKFYRSVILP